MIAVMDSMDAGSWKFAQALRSFDAGKMRVDSLTSALDADLAAGVSMMSLAELLDRHHRARPLPADVYETLAERLRGVDEGAAEEVTIDLDAPAKGAPMDALWGLDPTGPPLANRYQVLELIARGGTGEVYKAIDLQQAALGDTHHYVAVKLLPARTVGDEARAALEQHLARLQALVHANIARLLGWGVHGNAFYIAMEYVDGASLEARLRRGPLNSEQATLVVGKVADGLEAAHRQSIVHGDLTPANLLVTDSGEVKLIDFAWEGMPRRSLVTPRYASPQRMQRMPPTPADDIFALACITTELLTGKPAAAGGRGPAPLPRDGQLSDSQHTALRHALEPERSARTASARAFMQELTQPPTQPRRGWLKWLLAAIVLAVVVGLLVRRQAVVPRPASPPPVVVQPAPQPPPSAAGSDVRDCPTCATLRVLPAGTLVRGASPDDKTASSFEKPQQTVTIAYPFAVAINAVTVGEFQEFANATGRNLQGCEIYDGKWRFDAAASWQSPGFTQTLLHPVSCVSWNDATAYAAWLSARSGHHYRLPSAAEWEYAARAGGAGAVPWESQADACRSANVADQSAARRYPGFTVFGCDDSYVNTAPVGSYAANAFGLHDMIGNVFAWTQDCWSPSYSGAPQDGSARATAGCAEHELRGGSWFSSPAFVRASYRNHFAADYRGSSVGIRLVRDLSP